MDSETFREQVEAAAKTELDRLGSNKLLLAVTGADLTTETVLRSAVDAERASRDTFAEWADDESAPDVRDVFGDLAEQEREHLERVRAELEEAGDGDVAGGDEDDGEGASDGAVHESLRERTDTVERIAAGLVGRGLVGLRTHTQYVSFFVNEADTARADLFRDLKADVEEQIETGLALLADRCDGDSEWEVANDAAVATIEAAYEEYETALTELGMDPKPVC